MKKIVKKIIEPLQIRVLTKHMCVACTRNLDKQKRREPMTLRSEAVFCDCGRAYIFDKENKRYRRATNQELRLIPGFVPIANS